MWYPERQMESFKMAGVITVSKAAEQSNKRLKLAIRQVLGSFPEKGSKEMERTLGGKVE